jgi:hypothetical protein
MRQSIAKFVLLALLSLVVLSQDMPFPRGGRGGRFPRQDEPLNGREEFRRRDPNRPAVKFGEFTFTRLRYNGGYGRRGGWATDYPEADEHMIIGMRNWVQSTLHISDDHTTVAPTEENLFKYPFIYIVEPGRMQLTDEHAAQLREYLLRGGFLMLDDFWGTWEYANVQEQMSKVFPEYPIKELPLTHPLFHCYFDINEVIQVPQVGFIYSGVTYEQDGYTPHYEAVTDDNGRVMVFIARNADNGDAWEWIDNPQYPLKYGLAAYRLGTNCIVYSMTH